MSNIENWSKKVKTNMIKVIIFKNIYQDHLSMLSVNEDKY